MDSFTRWSEMPSTMTFDKLLSLPMADYTEKYGRWQIVLSNGIFYTGNEGEEVGRKCEAINALDTVRLHH